MATMKVQYLRPSILEIEDQEVEGLSGELKFPNNPNRYKMVVRHDTKAVALFSLNSEGEINRMVSSGSYRVNTSAKHEDHPSHYVQLRSLKGGEKEFSCWTKYDGAWSIQNRTTSAVKPKVKLSNF